MDIAYKELPLLIFYILCIGISKFPGAFGHCTGNNRTIFLRADNRVVRSLSGVTVPSADLRRCANLCSNNQDDKGKSIQCASFQLDSSTCTLSTTNAQPFGSGVLGRANGPNSANRICDKPYAFDWIPQSVLLGFAPEVQRLATVSDCLKACLESPSETPCRSAMFFYESQQCILNAESRLSRPDLFSNDTQGLIADYFDNACANSGVALNGNVRTNSDAGSSIERLGENEKFGGSGNLLAFSPSPSGYTGWPSDNYAIPPPQSPYQAYPSQGYGPETGPPLPITCDQSRVTQFIATENMAVQEGLDEKVESTDADTCRKLCENNKNARGDQIGCQAFSEDPIQHTCTLTSGLSMPRGNLHLVDRNGVNFYEKVCLAHAQSCNGKYPFTRLPAHVLVGHAGEVRRVRSVSDCLDACLYARTEIGYDCHSVMYYYATTECIMNIETRLTRPDLFSSDTQGLYVDYFDNNCIGIERSTLGYNNPPPSQVYGQPAAYPTPPLPSYNQPFAATTVAFAPGSLPKAVQSPAPFEGTASSYTVNPWVQPGYYSTPVSGPARPREGYGESNKVSGSAPELYHTTIGLESQRTKSIDSVTFFTDCQPDGIRVTATFKYPATGTLFAKNKLKTCKEEFRSTDNVVLRVPLSETQKDCGQKPSISDQYQFTVVLQQNGFGVQGLMTSDDLMYEVICDYGPSHHTTVSPGRSSTRFVVEGGIGASVPPSPRESSSGDGGRVLLPEAQVSMDLLRDGVPVSNVLLGEQLEIHWRITAPANIGFFVRDCAAERVGGNPPDPSPLQLISEGCPDNAVSGRIISSPIAKASDGLATNITVFRFDGSRSVRLRCLIDMCAGECTSTRCQIKNRELQSFGRRRRAALERASPTPVSASHIQNHTLRKATISGIFTIVDELPKISRQADGPVVSTSSPGRGGGSKKPVASSPGSNSDDPEFGESRSFMRYNGQMCLARPLFVGLMTTLALLCTAEGLVAFTCCWYRHCSSDSEEEAQPYSLNRDKLHNRLVAAVLRRSSFFATAFGGSPRSFSNSSTMVAPRNQAAARKKKWRQREHQRSGGSISTTTGDSEEHRSAPSVEKVKIAHRPMLPSSITATKAAGSDALRRLEPTTTIPLSTRSECQSRPRFTLASPVYPLTSGHNGEWMLSPPDDEPAPIGVASRDRNNRISCASTSSGPRSKPDKPYHFRMDKHSVKKSPLM